MAGTSGDRPPARASAVFGVSAGLCSTCRHAEVLASKASSFLRCGRERLDPSFPKYPRLPVVACAGYEPVDESGERA